MSLPALIEIVPLTGPVHATVTVPGSKSITNRALVLAALSAGETTLQGALWSEDTQVMVECLQELGFMLNVAPDPHEACNRTVTVYGQGGTVPRGGTPERPLELFVGNAGTAARFLAALLCLGNGVYKLHGVPRMSERPQAGLFRTLRELGYRIETPNDRLPVIIHGGGPKSGHCRVSITDSSQFASALLLSGRPAGWQVEIVGENGDESPYVVMTTELLKTFPHEGGIFRIEPDASSGSYFWAAGALEPSEAQLDATRLLPSHSQFSVSVANWPSSGWQIDAGFPAVWAEFVQQQFHTFSASPAAPTNALGTDPVRENLRKRLLPATGPMTISRQGDLGDSIMTAIVMAALGRHPTRFIGLGRLRVQECERVVGLRTELTKCGAKVIETGDNLEISPSRLSGTEIETYNDHRMAMCFAILGLKVAGIKLKNPACVKKTFPNFFQKLASPPPRGLGVTLLDPSGHKLEEQDLFAL